MYDTKAALVTGGLGLLVLAGITAATTSKSKQTKQLEAQSKATTANKTVLIVGGGVAGIAAIFGIRQHNRHVNIILVEPKEYAEILWAVYRSPFEEWVRKGSLIVLQKYCKAYRVQHIRGKITSLQANQAEILDLHGHSSKISFDVCTLCTGASSAWPAMGRGLPDTVDSDYGSIQGRLAALEAEGERLVNANHVVIIGGGLIGTELAGDIAVYSAQANHSNKKKKKITLIHSGPQLCPIMSPAAGQKVHDILASLGVTILLKEKATDITTVDNAKKSKKRSILLLNSNKEIEADVIIPTTGFTPNNHESFLSKDVFDMTKTLDAKGWIQVNDYLQVEGVVSDNKKHNPFFAFGDCMTALPNAGNVYMRLADTLGHNMQVALMATAKTYDKVTLPSMKAYEIPFLGFCNTAGPYQGVFYSKYFWTSHFLPWVKNQTMFFMAPRDAIGVKKEFTLLGE